MRGIWNFYQDAVVSSFHPQKERCPHALGVFINYVQGRHGGFLAIGRHSGSHFTSAPPLPLPFSISQNPAKDQALAALPFMAALFCSVHTDRQLKQDLYLMTLMSIEFNGTFLQKEVEYH